MRSYVEVPSVTKAEIKTLKRLTDNNNDGATTITPDVAEAVLNMAKAGFTVITMADSSFVLLSGEYVEFDDVGKPCVISELGWLIKNGFDSRSGLDMVKEIRSLDAVKRRTLLNALFVSNGSMTSCGNRNGISTKSRVQDMNSLELFSEFYRRLKGAVENNVYPELTVLSGYESVEEIPTNLKQSVRTWFKGITGRMVPNNKVVSMNSPNLYCTPLRELLNRVEVLGVGEVYQRLSEAIKEARKQNMTVSAFRFEV